MAGAAVNMGGAGLARRPLIGLFVAVAVGVWLGLHSPFPPQRVLALLLCDLAATGLLAWRAFGRAPEMPVGALDRLSLTVCILVGSFCLAAGRPDVGSLCERADVVAVRGVVGGEPEGVTWDDGNRRTWRFPLRVDALQVGDGDAFLPCSGHMAVRWSGGVESRPPPYGARVELRGRPDAWRGGGNVPVPPRLVTGAHNTRVISHGHGTVLHRWATALRRSSAATLSIGIEDSPQTVAVLRALLLGYRTGLPPALRDQFATTGTLHVFAISGLHVGIVAVLLSVLAGVAGVRRTHWVLVVAPLLAMYTFSTGAKPSAVRACVMAVLYYAAPWLGRRADALSALAAAALLIVLVAPAQLVNVGFVLSFTVVTGLIALYPVVNGALGGLRALLDRESAEREADNAMRPAAELVSETGAAAGAWRYARSLAVLSISAWLASTPLIAIYFGMFTPVSLIGNLVAIPLAFLSVLAGCLSIIGGQIAPCVADVFNHANLALIGTLTWVTRLLAHLPGGGIRVPPPPVWSVWLWYAALGWIVLAVHPRAAREHALPGLASGE